MTLRTLALLLTLAPALSTNAQPEPPLLPPPSGRPAQTDIPAEPSSVRLELNRVKPGLRVMINGKGPFLMLLDTGAGATVLSQDLVTELGLEARGRSRMGDPANPDSVQVDVVRLDSVQIGTATFTGIDALAHDRRGLYSGSDQPHGVLGYPLFAECLVTLDYPASQLQVAAGALPEPDGKEVLEYHMGEGGIPVFEIDVAGEKLAAHIDTGSPGGLAVPVEWESKLTLASPAQVVGRARSVSAEYEIRGGVLQGQVHLGMHTFDNPRIAFHPGVRIGNVGSRLLRDFRFTLDPANLRARFERVRPAQPPQPAAAPPASPPPAGK